TVRTPTVSSADETHYLASAGHNTTTDDVIGGNAVEPLRNGDALYPRLIDAIERAERQAWVSSYIFSGTGVGADIADALCKAANRGVDVRVLVDGVGALYTLRSLRRRLRDTAVRFAEFLPPRLVPPSLYMN